MNRRDFVLTAASLVLTRSWTQSRVALVTADLESRLVVVDLPSGRIRGHVRTLPFPRSIETVGNAVAHSEIGAVSIVDGRTLAVMHVLRGFDEPRYAAAHPDGRHAYVTDAGRGEVAAIDVVRGRVLHREQVGAHARHVTISPVGRTLWIALGPKATELALVDVSRRDRPRLVRRFRPDMLAYDVGAAPDGRHLWVTSGDRDELRVYDPRTGRVLARPSGDWPPQHVTFAGGLAYVTSGWSGTLHVLRVDGRPLSRTVVPAGSYNLPHADGWVLTPSLGRGDLCILDDEGRVLRSDRVARSSHDACVVTAA